MSDAQIWTALGILAAAFASTTTLTLLVLTSKIDGVRTEIGGVRAEIGGVRAEMTARFDGVTHRLDNLDRDVHALTRKVWRDQ